MDLIRPAAPAIKECSLRKRGEYTPQPDHVPIPLRQLRRQVVRALSCLDVDIGVYEHAPYGYWAHSSMIRFAWAAEDVRNKINSLPKRKDRKKGRKALS